MSDAQGDRIAALSPDEDVKVDPSGPAQTPQPRPGEDRSSQSPRRSRGWVRPLWIFVLVLLAGPVAWTALYRVAPPPITILMVERLAQGQGLDRQWRDLRAISPALPQAVIAAEDARFCTHRGFDFDAMRQAAIHNQRRPGRMRSTIKIVIGGGATR